MPRYLLEVFDRDTGAATEQIVEADGPTHAAKVARDLNLGPCRIVQQLPAVPQPVTVPPATTPATPPTDITLLTRDVRDLAADVAAIRRSRLVRAPIGTIAGAVIIASLLLGILGVAATLALIDLGRQQSRTR